MMLRKIYLSPVDAYRPQACFQRIGNLHAHWIWKGGLEPGAMSVLLFRLRLNLKKPLRTRIHVSADQRFELSINGARQARGPEMGDPKHRFVHSYELSLPAGRHTILVRAWWIGEMTPLAQMTTDIAGFFLVAEGPAAKRLSTGIADWDVAELKGYRFKRPAITWGTQADTTVNGSALPSETAGLKDLDWVKAMARPFCPWGISKNDGLSPSTLPDMSDTLLAPARVAHAARMSKGQEFEPLSMEQHELALAGKFNAMLAKRQPLTLAPNSRVQFLLDLQDYCCAHPVLRTKGGAGSSIRIQWAESLYHPPHSENMKGRRQEIEGKVIHADGDTFLPDGRDLSFDLLWWRAGRFVQLIIETKNQALTLRELSFFETRYPLKIENAFSADDKSCERMIPLMRRTLESCMHETYMDCPYYEQLQYVGDTRTESLTTFVLSRDARLPRKALQSFDWSRRSDGLTQSRFPNRAEQVIPPFSLWWIGMVHDYLMWRGERDFIASLLPGVRSVLDSVDRFRDQTDLVSFLPGWNFIDWAGPRRANIPGDGELGLSGLVNLQYVLALQTASALERSVGSAEMARIYDRRAKAVRQAVVRKFWNPKTGLFEELDPHEEYSEHMQVLALLAGACDAAKRRAIRKTLLKPNPLAKATIYFMHYLFEALPELDAMPYFFERLETWTCLPEQGFKTLPETPEPARSDCHAWGAHPLYHYYTKLLGITPASPGFETVRIEPRPCHLRHLRGKIPHPRGTLTVELDLDRQRATVVLPKGVSGIFVWQGRETGLKAGRQILSISAVRSKAMKPLRAGG